MIAIERTVMYAPHNDDISRFFIAGINYKKTDAAVRGQFAVTPDIYEALITDAKTREIREIFILSTCNRTEIYGIVSNADQLIDLLCRHTAGDQQLFRERAYIKSGREAISHLFNVGAGLDSQILGDYEIVGQIKQAVKFAKERGCVGAFIERMVNSVLQSSKTIKNQTELSGGTVSVSFSAVQYIRQNITDVATKKILLVGTGKIGRNTCRNLVDYLPTRKVTLINRTDEKARNLADELGLRHAPFASLIAEVQSADIILVATNSSTPTILAEHLVGHGPKCLIDLSIPYNVEEAARQLPGISMVNVDELSKLKDQTLHKRKAEVPRAVEIIAEHISDFLEWYEMRKHVPVLRAVKIKLEEIHCGQYGIIAGSHQERIQKVINGMAVKMRLHNKRGCHYIEAINEFIA